MKHLTSACLISLTACAPWPDVGGPSVRSENATEPRLEPLAPLLSEPARDQDIKVEADALALRAERLRARAAALRGDASDLEALRAQLAR